MLTENIKITDLSLDPANVRKHDRKNLDAIKASLRKFGQQKPIVVDAKGIVIAGNGTMTAAQELGWTDIAAVRTELVGVDATAFAIADNRSAELAEWDDKLVDVLEALKIENFSIVDLGFSEKDLAEIHNNLLNDDYTHKIVAPLYEAKGIEPEISELVDRSKFDKLIAEIDSAELQPELAQFLKQAATRHYVFNYEKIAEFYCHADKKTQTLIENSALIIIDFKKALQLGYVKLQSVIAEALEKN